MGGMWQTADVRSTAGFAGGFTLEKGIFENSSHFFSLAIRGRGLFGNTYGLDFNKNYDVKKNPALNGDYDSFVNYNDTTKANPYIYNNYKTQINEGSLELQITFNELREKTNVLLNLWGGIGFTSYRANTNLLNSNGQMYNYGKVDSAGSSKSAILSAHKNLLDKSYESYANGSKKNNVYTLSPSAGIGLGYKFGNGFSIIYEYKVTFPQGAYADYLDGITGNNKDMIAGNKDYYHYTGINFLFTLGRGKKTKSVNTTTTTNVQPITTHTVVNPPPTNTLSVNPVTTPPNVEKKPSVNFTNPSYSPYQEKRSTDFNVEAKVLNVSNRNQVKVSYNGMQINDFNFNGTNVSFTVKLNPGNNTVIVSATNNAGSDSKTAIINYSGIPPQIVFTNPLQNPFTTTVAACDVSASISNVYNNYDVVFKLNGSTLYNYSYSVQSGLFNSELPLNPGTNQLEINAVNPFGSDNKKLVINYSKPIATATSVANASRPVKVIITNPSNGYYKTNVNSHHVVANVTGVTSASQVTVTVNGINTPFNYNSGTVAFNAGLNEGGNAVIVSASNTSSSDSKSATITYEIIKKAQAPKVTITNPNPSPYTTNSANSFLYKANVYFVNGVNEIEVKYNGSVITNYNYNQGAGTIEYNAALLSNHDNLFEVKVFNAAGNNYASAIVKHQELGGIEIGIKTKVICHRKDRLNWETITINETDWAAHQAHGDYEGKCSDGSGNNESGYDPEITICHIATTGVPTTMKIKQSEWAAHQAHGDYMGACKVNKTVEPVEIDNDIIICHNDGNGGKQTLTIKQSQWATHQAHGDQMGTCPRVVKIDEEVDKKIRICHIPPGNSGNPQSIDIPQSAWPAHQAHGDYLGNCKEVVNSNDPGGIVVPVEDKKITICHIPPGNNSNPQTIEINESAWPAHQAHGDSKGACAPSNNNGGGNSGNSGNNDPQITICHIPPGNPNNPQTITIPQSAWPAHQAHGDTQGACAPSNNNGNGNGNGNSGNSGNSGNNNPSKKITICHKPPGNSNNTQTIEIDESAWPAHEAHGDTKGACNQKLKNANESEEKGLEPAGTEAPQSGKPIQPEQTEPKKETETIKTGRPR